MGLPKSKTARETSYTGKYADKETKKNLFFSLFDVIIRLEFDLDVISDKLE